MGLIKKIRLPEQMNEELAELVGIMLGDGSLQKNHNYTYSVRIAFDARKEKRYCEFVKRLIFNNFNILAKTTLNKKKNCITLYFYSKQLTDYFHEFLGIQYSPKNLKEIPNHVYKNDIFKCAFVRGLFDTDGCITNQKMGKYTYNLIKICTAHSVFAKNIKELLSQLRINSFICTKKDKFGHLGFDVVIRNKNCFHFFDIIGSNNAKNIEKWKQNGAAGI